MIYINQLKMVHPDELNEASIVTVREDVELGKGAKIIKMKIQCFLTWQVELSAGYYPHIHFADNVLFPLHLLIYLVSYFHCVLQTKRRGGSTDSMLK